MDDRWHRGRDIVLLVLAVVCVLLTVGYFELFEQTRDLRQEEARIHHRQKMNREDATKADAALQQRVLRLEQLIRRREGRG